MAEPHAANVNAAATNPSKWEILNRISKLRSALAFARVAAICKSVMSRLRAAFTFAFPVLASACASSAIPTVAHRAREGELVTAAYRPLFEEVARVRGRALKRPVAVRAFDEKSFGDTLERVHGWQGADPPAAPPVEVAFLRAFGFDEAPGSVPDAARGAGGATKKRSSDRDVVRDSVEGLYVSRERTLYVKTPKANASSDDEILVHEAIHAVQDDHFPLTALKGAAGLDEALARLAVYEGDATLGQWTVSAARAKTPTLASVADRQKAAFATSVAAESLLRGGEARQIQGATALVRERLLFPYAAGANFMAEVFATGGYALVDRVFARLPETTEQILHPSKYFDGEKAIPVATPSAPPGMAVVSEGTLGELQTRTFLRLSLPPELAIVASRGWGGDRFAIVAAKGRPLGLLWSTVWDDEASAARFDSALSNVRYCAGAGPCPEGVAFHARRGARVAFVRGIADGEGLVDALLDLPGAALASAPPFEDVAYRSYRSDAAASVRAGVLENPSLGIRSVVPDSFGPHEGAGALVVFRGTPALVMGGGILLMDLDVSGDAMSSLVSTLGAVLASVLQDRGLGQLRLQGTSEELLPIGKVKVVRWQLGDEDAVVRLSLLPICGGKKAIAFMELAPSERARVLLEQWMLSVSPMTTAAPPACVETRKR